MTLANRIIEREYQSGQQRREMDNRLARLFTAHARRHAPGLAAYFVRANFAGSLSEIAGKLRGALRLTVTPTVADAWEKMHATPMEIQLKAFPFARLPHNPTWIEHPRKSNPREVQGYMLEESGEGDDRIITITTALSLATLDYIPFGNPGSRFTLTKRGVTGFDGSTTRDVGILALLLLLNSRSQVLKVGTPIAERADTRKTSDKFKKRALLDIRPIEFDLSRVMTQAGTAMTVEAAQDIRAQQLVIGHFKVRTTGIFWWSPHWRNLDESLPAVMKDRHLVKNDVAAPQFTPEGVRLV